MFNRWEGLGNLAHSAQRNVSLTVCLFFPPFIYCTSHSYCITRFEDEDAICRLNVRLLTVERRGWSLL